MNGVFLRLMAELDAIGEFAVSANKRQSAFISLWQLRSVVLPFTNY